MPHGLATGRAPRHRGVDSHQRAYVVLETFGDFAMRWQRVLFAADCIIIAAFSVEVALRIWVGGRRYVFSFYGLVDIVSTYPFYLALIFRYLLGAAHPASAAVDARVPLHARIHILARAFASKKAEMSVSLQFLVIITFVLSIMLYHVEHSAQPEIYSDGFTSVAWAFAQYIGDPAVLPTSPIYLRRQTHSHHCGHTRHSHLRRACRYHRLGLRGGDGRERKADADNENIEKSAPPSAACNAATP